MGIERKRNYVIKIKMEIANSHIALECTRCLSCACVCVRACVRACVRSCVRACVRVCVSVSFFLDYIRCISF